MTEYQLDVKFYQKMGVCPMCRKNDLLGDEKYCPECRAIKYGWQVKWRKEHPEYANKKRREVYKQRSMNHQCTYCGIQLEEDYDFKMCPKCLCKNRIRLRKSRAVRGIG